MQAKGKRDKVLSTEKETAKKVFIKFLLKIAINKLREKELRLETEIEITGPANSTEERSF